MRLICPNCDAQYEVDTAVVPDGGRDVQCSNCGHTWFHAGATEEVIASKTPQPEPIAEETSTQKDDTPAIDAAPKQRELAPAVTDILREEAEREAQERQLESTGLETQPDLGLNNSGKEGAAIKDRLANLGELPREEIGVATAAGALRKDLLPDIEEINSTLEASSDRKDVETAEEFKEKRQRSGFRRGFTISLAIFAILALVYVYAPQIVAAYPPIEGAMATYVEMVNSLRALTDDLMRIGTEKLTGLLSQLTGGGES